MSEQVLELMRANLHDVFGERDAQARRAVVERIFTPDAVFSDDQIEVTGHEAIVEHAQAVLDRVPADFVFTEEGPLYTAGDEAALVWRFGPKDGDGGVRGIDIGTIVDGRLTRMRTLLSR